MKIRWRLRFKNPVTLISLLSVILTIAYTVLDRLGIMPAIAEGTINAAVVSAMQILALFGIVADPTTKGLTDSSRALSYNKPASKSEESSAKSDSTNPIPDVQESSPIIASEEFGASSSSPVSEIGTAGSQIRFYPNDVENTEESDK